MKDDNGDTVDDIVPLLLEVAHKYYIKVCRDTLMKLICLGRSSFQTLSVFLQVAFHIEPYKGRDEVNMFSNVKYIIEK